VKEIFLMFPAKYFKICGVFLLLTVYSAVDAQEIIRLTNPSFEDTGHSRPPTGWKDCGSFMFPGESPPDVQPSGSWHVYKPATDGDTYLGMVVRENDTWEAVSQALSGALQKGKNILSTSIFAPLKYI
jgi:hypothetical protein